MKKMKNDNKGFTLVELIVVLVILAILAAILVPALLGYIDEAKQKQIVLNGKSVYTAAQAVASEMYAKNVKPSEAKTDNTWADYADKIYKIADVDSFGETCTIYINFKDATLAQGATADAHDYYTVTYVYFKQGEDKVIEFDGKSWNAKESNYEATNKNYPITKKSGTGTNTGTNTGNNG